MASTLIELVKLTPDNVFGDAGWDPRIPVEEEGKVKLVDLFRFAKVFP